MNIDENSQRYLVKVLQNSIDSLAILFDEIDDEYIINSAISDYELYKEFNVLAEGVTVENIIQDRENERETKMIQALDLCMILDIRFSELKNYLLSNKEYEKRSLIENFIIENALSLKKY